MSVSSPLPPRPSSILLTCRDITLDVTRIAANGSMAQYNKSVYTNSIEGVGMAWRLDTLSQTKLQRSEALFPDISSHRTDFSLTAMAAGRTHMTSGILPRAVVTTAEDTMETTATEEM